MNSNFYRGEIYFVDGDKEYEKLGSVQGGGRPAVIVSNDIGNAAGPIVEIVYLTTQDKKPLPTHVKINSAKFPSIALCENIMTVYKDKVGRYIGQCTEAEMKKIDAALAVSIGIGVNIKSNALVEKWRDATTENEREKEVVEVPQTTQVAVSEKTEKEKITDMDCQIKLAKAEAERDVYKKLYEDLIARKVG